MSILYRDIGTLRQAHAEQQNEKATMATKSQAVMNLNLKLQSTAVKSQARLITAEIAKLELAQAEEQLQIVQVSCAWAGFLRGKGLQDHISLTSRQHTLRAITMPPPPCCSGNGLPPRPNCLSTPSVGPTAYQKPFKNHKTSSWSAYAS
jgi:hypothetical protein